MTPPCRRIPTSSWLLLCRRGGQFPARDRGFGEANSAFGRLRGLLYQPFRKLRVFFGLCYPSEARWAAEISPSAASWRRCAAGSSGASVRISPCAVRTATRGEMRTLAPEDPAAQRLQEAAEGLISAAQRDSEG